MRVITSAFVYRTISPEKLPNFEGLESYIEAIDSIFKENGCKWTFTIMPAVDDFENEFNSLISKLNFNSDFDPKHSLKIWENV